MAVHNGPNGIKRIKAIKFYINKRHSMIDCMGKRYEYEKEKELERCDPQNIVYESCKEIFKSLYFEEKAIRKLRFALRKDAYKKLYDNKTDEYLQFFKNKILSMPSCKHIQHMIDIAYSNFKRLSGLAKNIKFEEFYHSLTTLARQNDRLDILEIIENLSNNNKLANNK